MARRNNFPPKSRFEPQRERLARALADLIDAFKIAPDVAASNSILAIYAKTSLISLAGDLDAPPAVRAAASRSLAEMAGALGSGRNQPSSSATAAEMSLDQLDAAINLASRQRDVV